MIRRQTIQFKAGFTTILSAILLFAGSARSASAAQADAASAAAPEITISASRPDVFIGESLTLIWSSKGAASCTAGGAWRGKKAMSGSQMLKPAAAGDLVYDLSCTGAGGASSKSVKVLAQEPSLSLTDTFLPNAVTISTSEGAPYGDCNFWTAKASNCIDETNFGYGPTRVVRVYICLSGEVSIGSCSQQPKVTGPLSEAMLKGIESRIAAFSGTGVRLVVRFTYNFGPIGPAAMDAPLDVIARHIDQVAPILLRHRDLVFALEAGFIGTWGEWHDSTNNNDTAAAQKTVLDKELSYFRGAFPILVRYPGDLIQYAGGTTPRADLGLHDDYYASNTVDGATWDNCDRGAGYCLQDYTAEQFQAYAATVSTTAQFAGEFGALYPNLQTCDELDAYSYQYHAQSISLFPYPPAIGMELESEGCALSFFNKVGVRIELHRATVIGDTAPNGRLDLALTLSNSGYGRVLRPRPATLVFISGGVRVARIPIPLAELDLRELASSSTPIWKTLRFSVKLPETFRPAGPSAIALVIPDPAPTLKADPAYALPLNSIAKKDSVAIFDPTTGFNVIAKFNAK